MKALKPFKNKDTNITTHNPIHMGHHLTQIRRLNIVIILLLSHAHTNRVFGKCKRTCICQSHLMG